MPAIDLLSQFNKREQTENKGGDNGDDRSPAVIVGLVIAALTLLLAIMSYRHSRLSHLVSSSSPSLFLKACQPSSLSLLILIYSQSGNPPQQAPRTPPPKRSTPIPLADPTGGGQVIFYIYHGFSNAQFAGAHSATFSDPNNSISGGDMRVHVLEHHGNQGD
ncbi:hypothetical protein B9Z19DRAFT_441577 [Tuber borchii]|uniref:Uncharacterized protein n=1 Tax=Tuber borchii TaxID=42251 RepID=A0A2T6ZG47_TUBBO|nr:hypothetical protein B9Z19DRAFT_441577 [Tuber borchii]